MTRLEWAAAITVTGLVAAGLTRALLRRSARRTVFHFRPRIDRFKLTRKRDIVATLLADPEIAAAVKLHAGELVLSEAKVWAKVRRYLDEIIPFFNVLAYYRFGYGTSRVLLNLFYKVSVEYARPDPFRGLPRIRSWSTS